MSVCEWFRLIANTVKSVTFGYKLAVALVSGCNLVPKNPVTAQIL